MYSKASASLSSVHTAAGVSPTSTIINFSSSATSLSAATSQGALKAAGSAVPSKGPALSNGSSNSYVTLSGGDSDDGGEERAERERERAAAFAAAEEERLSALALALAHDRDRLGNDEIRKCIHLRTLCPGDIVELKTLCAEWFPIE